MTITTELSKMAKALTFDDLSEEVIDRTKYLLLDFVGLAARGNHYESNAPILNYVKRQGLTGNGVVIGNDGETYQPHYAALLNGAAAHSLELDDVINEASLHPAVVIFPTALAQSVNSKRSGKDVLVASILGYEVMGRIGKAMNPSSLYSRGFHPTGLVGTFGAIATSAKLMDLSVEETVNAYGVGGSQTSASMEFLNTDTWTKRFHPGWAAHNGLFASGIASLGFTGPKTIIEGDRGFAKSYASDYSLTSIGNDFKLKESYVLKTSIKPHACCRYKQAPLDIILSLVNKHNIQPDEVESVTIDLVKTALPIVALPEEIKRNPQSTEDAQFSMHYGAAVAVLYRKTLLEQYENSVIQQDAVTKMMKNIHCRHEPKLDSNFPIKWPARVSIQTTRGTFYDEIDYPKGDPENPLTWDELIEKFRYVTEPIYSFDQQTTIIETIRNLENINEINQLNEQDLFNGGVKKWRQFS
ncbi:MmgE/PrpD family protein [Geomicrobium sp. JCM 19038]|uniref:MmgE/PrpD family protein n=1 Tax=Geomicrobium sp. JCM 19038 TaxID=1460635 RepID=UPI00045F298F|nr:MmgE/PrpD family protein [Geomicrobium sp. JCM 19038]GAK09878.1 immune-responsive protein 1 [Geomicrobium sp. JCM 19038]